MTLEDCLGASPRACRRGPALTEPGSLGARGCTPGFGVWVPCGAQAALLGVGRGRESKGSPLGVLQGASAEPGHRAAGGQQPVTIPEQPRLGAGESGPLPAEEPRLRPPASLPAGGPSPRRLAPWGHRSCAAGDPHAREEVGGRSRRLRTQEATVPLGRALSPPSLPVPAVPLVLAVPTVPADPKGLGPGPVGRARSCTHARPSAWTPAGGPREGGRGGLPQASVSATVLPEAQKVPHRPCLYPRPA